jgi:ferric-dicitrate binding protein FerR (iron transport regulator)
MESSRNEHIDDLILACLDGSIDGQRLAELKEWISASEANRTYFHEKQELWISSLDKESLEKFDWEQGFRRFETKIDAARTTGHGHRSLRAVYRWVGSVAACLLLILSAYILYSRGERAGEDKLYGSLADVKMEAPLGSQTKVVLPDGTKVILNSGSRIVYSQGFGIKDRIVRLTGEAYFEVKHEARVPMEVLTGSLRLKDIGTKFSIMDYSQDEEAVVSLDEGSVTISASKEKQGITMHPGETVRLDKKSGVLSAIDGGRTDGGLWRNGLLVFNNEPMWKIARTLARAYNVEITIQSKTAGSECYFGSFNRNEQSVTEILDALSATGTLKYKIAGRHVSIY